MPSEAEIREKVERLMKHWRRCHEEWMPNQRPEGTPGKSSPSNPSQVPGALNVRPKKNDYVIHHPQERHAAWLGLRAGKNTPGLYL